MTDLAPVMLARSHEFLQSAIQDLEQGRPNVAYEDARTAAELAGKILLLLKSGEYPRIHAIGGPLYQAGLIPTGIDPSRLSRLLKERTRADYGFTTPIEEHEAKDAVEMARALLAAAKDACEGR